MELDIIVYVLIPFHHPCVVEISANPNRIYDPSFGTVTDVTTAAPVEQQWVINNVVGLFVWATGTWTRFNPSGVGGPATTAPPLSLTWNNWASDGNPFH